MPKGVVSKVFVKDWDDGTKAYSFKLQGDDTFYRLGKITPQFAEGASIQFDAVTKGQNTYVNESPAPWVGDGTSLAPAVQSVRQDSNGGYYKGSGKKPFGKSEEEKAYWKGREVRDVTVQQKIEIQAARNAAIQTASFMWEKELVKVPTKQADKYDAFLVLVDQIADTFQKLTEAKITDSNGRVAESSTVAANTSPPAVTQPSSSAWEE